MDTMYNTLLKLPLFQGISQKDMTTILGKVKLHFIKYDAGDTIVESGTRCKKLFFLLKGEITSEKTAENKLFGYVETNTDPYLIEVEALFGINPVYKGTYKAKTTANIMTIEKKYVHEELLKYEVFRMNYINYISTHAQTFQYKLWNTLPEKGAKDKIIRFLLKYAGKPEGEKTVYIRMLDLAGILDETRLSVSNALNDLQKQGLIELSRQTIYVPELSKLIHLITKIP